SIRVLCSGITGISANAKGTADGELAPTMPHGSYSLGEIATQFNMVRLRCDKCGRRGQYRVDKLLKQYGPDIPMPDLRHELAQCPHRRNMSDPRQVRFVDRLADL